MFISGIFIAIASLPLYGRVLSWFSPVSYAADLLYKGWVQGLLRRAHDVVMLVAFAAAMFALSVIRMRAWNK